MTDFATSWSEAEAAYAQEKLDALGHLYFIRAGNAVKIGRTVNIVNRLGKMQADNHEELDCILLLNGRGQDEALWHKTFSRLRIRGEWFARTAELVETIEHVREHRDWKPDQPRVVAEDDWRIGSPLYAGNPKYPQYQLPPSSQRREL
jgi:hypothetical protein